MDDLALNLAWVAEFRGQLITWGKDNFRYFPWRETRDPYQLLIAETLLHRTQAKQVVEVYLHFVRRFPNADTLNRADGNEVRELVFTLGLFWRSDLLIKMGQELVNNFGGQVPWEKEKLITLPGVGDYIASSVRCFAFGLSDCVIDTNVMRVITRVLGIPYRDSLRRNRKFKAICQELVDPEMPREYNFAILDLASLICRPETPRCKICPIHKFCNFYLVEDVE